MVQRARFPVALHLRYRPARPRALSVQATGALRPALEDAMRLFQVNRANAEGAELLRRLRSAAAGTGAVGRPAGAGPASSGGASSSSSSRMSVDEVLTVLRGGGGDSSPSPSLSSSGAPLKPPRLGASAATDVLASLTERLKTQTGASEFLTADGPCLLLSRLPEGSTTAAFNVLIPLCARLADGWGREWADKWASAPTPPGADADDFVGASSDAALQQALVADIPLSSGSARSAGPGSVACRWVHPAQRAAVSALCGALARHFLPTLAVLLDAGSGVGFSPSSAQAVVQAATAALSAALALMRPAMERQQRLLLGDRAGLKKGTRYLYRLRLGLPAPLEEAAQLWAQAVGALLRRTPSALPPQPGKGAAAAAASAAAIDPQQRDYSLHTAVLSAVAHILRSAPLEAVVEAAFAAGTLAAATGLAAAVDGATDGDKGAGGGSGSGGAPPTGAVPRVSPLAAEARRSAQACVSLAMTTLRDAHPRGHTDTGRMKLRRVLSALTRPLVADLAAALPQPRAPTGGDGSGGGGRQQQQQQDQELDPFYGDDPFPLTTDMSDAAVAALPAPDWSPDAGGGVGDDRARAVVLLGSSFLVDRDVGLWLAGQQGVLPAVFITAAAPWPQWQAAAAEAVSQLASDDAGRGMLTSLPDRVVSSDPPVAVKGRLDVMALLRRLSDAGAPSVRASAAVTLAKLTSPTKAFTQAAAGTPGAKGADEMVAAAIDHVRASAGLPPAAVEEEEEELGGGSSGSKPPAAERFAALVAHFSRRYAASVSLPVAAAPKHPAPAAAVPADLSVDLEAASKAVEALAVLAGHTRTKAALVGSRGNLRALTRLAAAVVAGLETQRRLRRAQLAAAERASLAAAGADGDDDAAAVAADAAVARAGGPLLRAELRPAAYGLAYILHCVTISRTRQQEMKLAEMDVDVAQWRELQRLLTPSELREAGVVAPEGGEAEDPQPAVEGRVRALLGSGTDTLSLLSALSEAVRGLDDDAAAAAAGASSAGPVGDSPAAKREAEARAADAAASARASNGAATRDLVAATLGNIAEWQWARGQLVAAGALPLLLDVATADGGGGSGATAASAAAPSVSLEGALAAANAISRILITTNPALIPPGQVADVVPALLRVCRESSSDLQQFEAAMALTNVASSGGDSKAALVKRGGLPAVEFVQFSEHAMLRRAGTECLANLATTDEGARLITGSDRVGLWLALARGYEAGGGSGSSEGDGEGGGGKAAPRPGGKKRGGGKGAAAAATDSGGAVPKTAAEAAAFLKKRRTGGGGGKGDDRDNATAAAAAGGLAMALGHLVDARPSSSRDPRVHAEARAAVYRFVDAGGVATAAELLLSGQPALAHRAVACLSHVALYARGSAALLTPLGGSGGDGAAGAGASGVADGAFLSCAALLTLLAQGRDPAALAQGAGSSSGGSAVVPPPIVALSRACVARLASRVAASGWPAVAAAAEGDGTAPPGEGDGEATAAAVAARADVTACRRAASFAPLPHLSPEQVALWQAAAGDDALADAADDVAGTHDED
jgi:hypothetical protein